MCTESHVIYETTVSNHVCSFFVRQPCQTYNYTTTNNSPQHGVDEVVVDRPGPVRPDRRPAGPPARPSGLLTRPSMKALLTSRRSGLPTQWWPHTERFSSIVAILTRCVWHQCSLESVPVVKLKRDIFQYVKMREATPVPMSMWFAFVSRCDWPKRSLESVALLSVFPIVEKYTWSPCQCVYDYTTEPSQ